MFSKKLKTEKIEMVKRIIRQNHYADTEKSMQQCIEMGLVVNLSALKRFSEKLELIDRIKLSKQQDELRQIETAQANTAISRYDVNAGNVVNAQQTHHTEQSPAATLSSMTGLASKSDINQAMLIGQPSTRRPQRSVRDMTYNEIKQREAEITFALGELKIKETELLQELISLTEWLDKKEMN